MPASVSRFLTVLLLLLPGPALAGAACGIFVAKTGANTATCGLDKNTPCLTVQQGLDRAVVEGAPCVFVQAGLYVQTVSLKPGVSVIGGFDANWVSGPYTQAGHVSEIRGVANQVDGQSSAAVARNTTPAAVLQNLILTAPNASGLQSGTLNGKSSYVIHASGSNLVLRDCRLVAGNGAAGSAGANGADATAVARTSAMNGGTGGTGATSAAFCDATSHGSVGPNGANAACASANGGDGGAGGTMDSDCSFPQDFGANVGVDGADAVTVSGTFGLGGPHGTFCTNGSNGNGGRFVNGAAGLRGDASIDLVGSPAYLAGKAGTSGVLGAPGGGGGGGGGEGGCDSGVDSWGSGGGGGGAGGCAAVGRGGGGGGGGGSYGIALVLSHLDIANCEIQRGSGANGGAGGSGGRGQQGGLAGSGGNGAGGRHGGAGGIGGHGGHGGGGGGGAGGASVGIARCSATTLVSSGVTFIGGSAGSGGPGGISAPGAGGTSDDDGNDAQAGVTGSSTNLLASLTCSATLPNLAFSTCDIATCLLVDAPSGGTVPGLAFAGLAPNPTAGGGRFDFSLPHAGRVRLALYDQAGRRRRTLIDAIRDAGVQAAAWDGRDDAGRRLASGIYLARLEFAAAQRVERVVVIH